MLSLTNKDSMINQLQLVSAIREEAIDTAKENCQKLKNYVIYGIPTVLDRMPNPSTSVLKSSGSNNHHDLKCDIITDELNDYEFVHRMKTLINSLPDTYKDTFVSVYINGKPISSMYRSNIYTVLNRGYLKLALLDATINYSSRDELAYQNLKVSHNTRKKQIIKKMKAELYDLRSLYLSGRVEIEKDDFGRYVLLNRSADVETYNYYADMLRWINQLSMIKNVKTDSKKAIMKLIKDSDWKYLSTTDRRAITKGLLALAYLDQHINYTYEELKYDAKDYFISMAFLASLKNFQFQLPV